MEKEIRELGFLQNKILEDIIKYKEHMIKTALIEKGFNPEDRKSLEGHLNCKIYLPDNFIEHYYVDDVHIITINTEWRLNP